MEKTPLHYTLSLRIHRERKAFGIGIDELLHNVESEHSLRAAAIRMNMAYSKAWSIVKTAEEEFGFKLLTSKTGGRNGGGAELTNEARALLADYEAFRSELSAAADALFPKYFSKYE